MKELIRSKKKQGTAKLAGAFGLLLALTLMVGLVAMPAMAIPQLPHRFFGEVTYEPSGSYVEEDARVSAEIYDPGLADWVEVASTLVVLVDDTAWYDFNVPADSGADGRDGGEPGDEIRFYVKGVLAGIWGDDLEEPGFENGGSDRFDLEVFVVFYDLTVNSDGCCPITVGDLGEVGAGATEVLFPDILEGTEVELTAEVPVCCNFVEWAVDGDPIGGNPITVTMDSDHAAIATCTEVGLLTLTIDVVGDGDVEVNEVAPEAYPEEYPFECCTDVDLEAIPTDECWYFTGWTGDLSGTENPTTIHIDGNKTVTASFAKFEYTLTVAASPTEGGTVTGGDTYDCSTTVDVEAIPTDDDWFFTGWSGDLDGTTNPTTIHMDGNKTVTANFALVGEPHDLTVTSIGCCPITVVNLDTTAELGTVDPGATEVLFPDIPYGTEVELTAEVPVCCNFVGWAVDGAPVGGNPITVTMDSDHEAVATCSEVGVLTLTVDVVGEGDVEVDGVAPEAYPAVYPFECCTDVGLEAIPADGWVFTGWSDDLDGTTNPTTIHMDENKTVTANFAEIGETNLTVYTTPGGTVTAPGVGTFPYDTGTVVDLVAVRDCGYRFVSWTGDVDTVANPNSATTSIIMNDDYEITANFADGALMSISLSTEYDGWNTFSTPIALDPCCDTWDELADLNSLNLEIVYYFDVSTKDWGLVTTMNMNEHPVVPLEGFYVKVASEGTVDIIPSPDVTLPPSKVLSPELNLIGPAPESLADEDVVSILTTVYGFPPDPPGYLMVISPEVNADAWGYNRGDLDPPMMRIGEAYWVVMSITPYTYWGSSSTPIW